MTGFIIYAFFLLALFVSVGMLADMVKRDWDKIKRAIWEAPEPYQVSRSYHVRQYTIEQDLGRRNRRALANNDPAVETGEIEGSPLPNKQDHSLNN